ncbi:MAG: hypothetical protein QOG90_1862 [Actinomycetota bacterium]
MNKDIDDTLNALARNQFGAIGRWQLGVRRDAVDRRVEWGLYRDATPRVIVSTSSPDTFEQRATVARLDAGPGAAISVFTTLAWVGLSGFTLEPIHVARKRRDFRKPPNGVVSHIPRNLLPEHIIEVNGLITTTPTRALADMLTLPRTSAKRSERALDNARSSRLTNHVLLSRMADQLYGRGWPGTTFLRDYLERKPVDWVPPASNVARRFVEIITDAGFPEPRSEVDLGDEIAWLGRVDCLDPELPLVAEIDSDRFHTAPLDVESDARRDASMTRAGFAVIRFTEHDVWHNPRSVIDRWRAKRTEVRRSRAV